MIFDNHLSGTVSRGLMYKVYAWMSVALSISAVTAYIVGNTPSIAHTIFSNPLLMLVLFGAQLGIVIYANYAMARLEPGTLAGLFVIYSLLMGVTLGSVFLVYTHASILSTFIVTAGMFGIMCLYGYFTNTDLTSVGNFAVMALFGLILGWLVNMFFQSDAAALVFSWIGVFIFVILTAYDVQKIKRLAAMAPSDAGVHARLAIMGAMTLYLDFINLFLSLLRIMGSRRD